MTPGKYNLPDIRRGDTWSARAIATITDSNGNPVALSSARMQIRHKNTGALIYEWSSANTNITVSSNVVTISKIPTASSVNFPLGNQHDYDLEVTTSGGDVWTILEGKVNITEDYSK